MDYICKRPKIKEEEEEEEGEEGGRNKLPEAQRLGLGGQPRAGRAARGEARPKGGGGDGHRE